MSDPVQIATIVCKGVFVKGDMTIHSSIRIEGTLEGNLISTGEVVVASSGVINGNLTAKEAVINGMVNGNITATGTAVLEPNGTLNGDLYASKVTLNEGSKFNGKCTMISRKELVIDKETKDVKLVVLSPEEILTQL